jgi:hypothetical protein
MATWSDRPPSISVSAKPFELGRGSGPARGIHWLRVGVLIVAVLVPAPTSSQTATLDRILAIVDGQIIMHSDVRAFIDLGLVDIQTGPSQEVEVLTWLIERRVVLDQVNRFVVAEPDPGTVDRRLYFVRSQVSDDAELELILDRVGLAPADLRQLVADDLRRDAYLVDRFEVVADGLREAAISDWVEDLVRRAQVRRVSSSEGETGH